MLMDPKCQWLGPSWHAAFCVVYAARSAVCEKGVLACKTDQPRWWLAIDADYGKDLLDDLQRYVVGSTSQTFMKSSPVRKSGISQSSSWKRIACEKSRTSQRDIPGTVVYVAKMDAHAQRSERSKVQPVVMEDAIAHNRKLAWQVQVEESKCFVENLMTTYPNKARTSKAKRDAQTSPMTDAMQQTSVMKASTSHAKSYENFMKTFAVHRNGISQKKHAKTNCM